MSDHAVRPAIARSRLGTAAAVLTVGTDLLYLGIIAVQEPVDWPTVIFFATTIFLAGAAAGVASTPDRTLAMRLLLFAAAAGALLCLGIIGVFSIGLPLLVAGTFCAIAWLGAWAAGDPTGARAWVPSLVAFGAAALLPLGGAIAL